MIYEELKKKTLLDVFLLRLKETPDRTVLKFLDDKGNDSEDITYKKIDTRARSIAKWLKRKTSPGDRIGLMYAQSPEFMYTYMGCLYAQCIPVPMNIPIRRQAVDRMQAILKDSGIKIICTDRNLHRLLWIYFLFKKVKFVPSAKFKKTVTNFEYPELKPEDIALLQYTSGSTGDPNGVMVTHKSLLYQLYSLILSTKINENNRVISWLPSFHDMGFIGGYALPIFVNSLSILMSPLAFLKNPLHWIKAISRLKVDSTYVPNFGLGISAAKVKPSDLEGIDLSCWQQVYCGSEPIRKQTIDDFYDRFIPAGMHHQALYPCYGMAETVLVISMAPRWTDMKYLHVSKSGMKQGRIEQKSELDEDSVTVFSCGPVWGDTTVEIVDPDTSFRKKPGEIGEIWVKGSTVTAGYWNNPEKTKSTFDAKLLESGESGWLKTGDLGVLIDDELYVTGRLKDLIIVRGQNYFPHDLESVVEGLHPAMRINNCSVFSVEGKERERIILLQEIRKKHEKKFDPDKVFQLIRTEIGAAYNVGLDGIALIPQGTLPKTTSGKIQRNKSREKYMDGSLKILHKWEAVEDNYLGLVTEKAPETAFSDMDKKQVVEWLTRVVVQNSRLDNNMVDSHVALTDQGVDSVEVVQVTDTVEQELDISLPPDFFWEHSNLQSAADQLIKEYRKQKV